MEGGVKQYWLKLEDNSIKSVFTGIKKNTVTKNEINKIIIGLTVVKSFENLFYPDNQNLNINSKNIKRRIKWNADKILIGNNYQPLQLNFLLYSLY